MQLFRMPIFLPPRTASIAAINMFTYFLQKYPYALVKSLLKHPTFYFLKDDYYTPALRKPLWKFNAECDTKQLMWHHNFNWGQEVKVQFD
jgi:hypothetical protein